MKKHGMMALWVMVCLTMSAQSDRYEWHSLPFGGAGFVSGIISSSAESGLIVCGDMNVYGRVYMSTVGRGVICGELVEDADGIHPTPSSEQARDGVYDLSGRKLPAIPSHSKGIYIVDGKKRIAR